MRLLWRCRKLQSEKNTAGRGLWRYFPSLQALEDRLLPSLTPHLLRDVNFRTLTPYSLTSVGSTLFFTNNDGLWRSDGTALGTILFSSARKGAAFLTNVDGTIYFTNSDAAHGPELWKTNGTAAGTLLVADINPGANGSYPSDLTNFNGTLFFQANDGTHGPQLWKSNGSAAGTSMVADIGGNKGSYPADMTNLNGTLLFAAFPNAPGPPAEVWRTNGTAAGTVLVKSLAPGFFEDLNDPFTNVNGTAFFSGSDGQHPALWRTNGTAGGTFIVPTPSFSDYPTELINVNGTLFFSVSDGTHGEDLWRSNGAAGGTSIVNNIDPQISFRPTTLTNVNGTLLFFATDHAHGTELWRSNGTAAGTALVRDINSGGSSYPPHPRYGPTTLVGLVANVSGTFFFDANDGTHGFELWRSNGTAAGTSLVDQINHFHNPVNPGGSYPYLLTNVNGTLFFDAQDGTAGPDGVELWRSQGTAAGTAKLSSTLDSTPMQFTNLNGSAFFFADDGGLFQGQIWGTNGTNAGTFRLTQNGFEYPSAPNDLANVNGTLFFVTNIGRQLWRSNGTVAGTMKVQDLNSLGTSTYPAYLTNVNGTVFFDALYGSGGIVFGTQLWRSDGTAAGTSAIANINGSTPKDLTNVNGTLFFQADDGTHGAELWESNGASTFMVKDIDPGGASSNPANFTNVNGTLFFSATNGISGQELWRSNGTTAGTVLVRRINLGPGGSSPSYLTNVSGTLFFTADDGIHGRELWRSNGVGTGSGTVLVKDISPGTAGSDPSGLTNVSGTLFFSAPDAAGGRELWRSNGVNAGTTLVSIINPGSVGSNPTDLTKRQRHAFLQCQQRQDRPGALAKQRHRRRHPPCARYLPRSHRLLRESANQHQRHPLLQRPRPLPRRRTLDPRPPSPGAPGYNFGAGLRRHPQRRGPGSRPRRLLQRTEFGACPRLRCAAPELATLLEPGYNANRPRCVRDRVEDRRRVEADCSRRSTCSAARARLTSRRPHQSPQLGQALNPA